MNNPYEKGTDEYLDFATKQHDAAMAKPKTKPVVKKKVIEHKPQGLAGDDKISQALDAQKKHQKIGQNLIGAAVDSLVNM